MPGLPWSKFFWRDYEADEAVKQCSFAAQGLWMRLLCLCAKGDPYGYLSIAGVALDVAGVSTAVGRPETEIAPLIAELDRWGVFSRDRKGRIYCRRMVRAEQASNRGRKFANKRWLKVSENTDEKSIPNGVANGPPMTQRPEAREEKTKPETEPSTAEVVPLAPRAKRASSYAFEGRVIRLTSDDFERWRTSFHGIPDLAAELTVIDIWLFDRNQSEGWFHRTAGMLNRKHQELQAQKQETAKRPWERPWTIGVG